MTDISSLVSVPALAIIGGVGMPIFTLVLIPLQLLLAPLFWIYVRNLTAEKLPQGFSFDVIHLIFPLLTIVVPLVAIVMPSAELVALFNKGQVVERSLAQQFIVVSVLSYNTLVVGQYAFYVVVIIRRLSQYRSTLVHLFASNAELELAWFRWLAGFLILYIALVLLSTTVDVLLDLSYALEPWESMINLALIWVLAVWGLRQTPGLAIEVEETAKLDAAKYEHSALSDIKLESIATKIEDAMRTDGLYRDSELSLSTLSKHIGKLPNYVSQSLNMQLEQTFFDYVNRWRVQDAMRLLEQSSENVLTISNEVGFNSRSSFYTAFKKVTGNTPTAYRKQTQNR